MTRSNESKQSSKGEKSGGLVVLALYDGREAERADAMEGTKEQEETDSWQAET